MCEIIQKLDLEDWQRIAQILFYITAGTVAVKTYLKAKLGLLNSINTEYQKRVMDRLSEISADLAEQIDYHSPKHLMSRASTDLVVDQIIEEWRPYKDEFINKKEVYGDIIETIPVPQAIKDLSNKQNVFYMDPFVPDQLNIEIAQFYQAKAKVIYKAYMKVFYEFQKNIFDKNFWAVVDASSEDLSRLDVTVKFIHENMKLGVHANVVSTFEELGYKSNHFDDEVNQIQKHIKRYLQQFDSLTQ